MPFCANCGTQAAGGFCPNCGARTEGAAAGPGPGFTASAPPVMAQSSGLTDNLASALCYTPFIIGLVASIIFLVAAPYNRNRTIRFHAFQSLFLHLGLFVFWVVLQIVVASLTFITHGFGVLLFGLYPILSLAILGLFLYMMFTAYNNRKIKLPVVGDYAEKQA